MSSLDVDKNGALDPVELLNVIKLWYLETSAGKKTARCLTCSVQ